MQTNKLKRVAAIEKELEELKKEMTKDEKDPEKTFLSMLDGLTVRIKDPDSIFYFEGDDWIFEQDFKNGYFWCQYDKVWSVFETDHGLNYNEIRDFVKTMLEKYFKCSVLTPVGM